MAAQRHVSDPHVLDRRTLTRDHRRLAALLRPGMRVLDVGCGTGAITVGIARAVGPSGLAIGIDRDPALLRHARTRHGDVPALHFEERDVSDVAGDAGFDVVTAARVLQWLDDPAAALARMVAATRPRGQVVVLDYAHADLEWTPAPPAPVRLFYAAFLAWRAAHGWDNRLAHRLQRACEDAGLEGVSSSVEDECVARGEPDFDPGLAVWSRVMESIGPVMTAAGALAEDELAAAAVAYAEWARRDARRQHMVLRAVVGHRPDGRIA